jgi:hypothetical protein
LWQADLKEGRYATSLSGAAKAITQTQSETGWWFWLTYENGETDMADLRHGYLDQQGLGTEAHDKDDKAQ